MPRFKEGGRVSRLQNAVLRVLKQHGQKKDYGELRDKVMKILKIDWNNEDSFKASFSRSLSNMAKKGWIKKINRYSFFDIYCSIKLREKGLIFANRLK